mmetsp:Transcript_3011/g.6681  ORF Transcript_3011/g.6681 Transcript_3011/m.6681 type:complete len:804 (-) Transcript_3011:92-2503(-)
MASPVSAPEETLAARWVAVMEEISEALYQATDRDVAVFSFPLAYSRVVVPAYTGEAFAARVFQAVVLAWSATWHLSALRGGHLEVIGVIALMQACSYAISFAFSKAVTRAGVASAALLLPLGLASIQPLAVDVVSATLVAVPLRAAVATVVVLVLAAWTQSRSYFMLSIYACVAALVVGAPEDYWTIAGGIARYLWPIDEFLDCYAATESFVGAEALKAPAAELSLITAHAELSMGFQFIAFIRSVQDRSNALFEVGPSAGSRSAHDLIILVRQWLVCTCMPYLGSRFVFSNIVKLYFSRFRHWTERSLRLHSMFPESGGTMLGTVATSKYTVDVYSNAINGAVEHSYGLIAAKLQVLPKLILLPGLVAAKPWVLAVALPGGVALDISKAATMTYLSKRIEAAQKELHMLASLRSQMEAHDARNYELIQRGHASGFAREQWRQLGDKIEDRGRRVNAWIFIRSFLDKNYRENLFGPAIECVLAFILEVGYATISDVLLYQTLLGEALGTLLMKHRSEAELATMRTQVEFLRELAGRLEEARNIQKPTCEIVADHEPVRLRALSYTRGRAQVEIDDLSLPSKGIVAVTGANGCGKSTALALLAACSGYELPSGVSMPNATVATIQLPAGDVVEIAQNLYCPLFSTPMAWLLQPLSGPRDQSKDRDRAVELLKEFGLLSAAAGSGLEEMEVDEKGKGLSLQELDAEKQHWYGELSGGERVKVEFIRKVFLQEGCPRMLLIDEAFAPLDPMSKQVMQTKLKAFCAQSLVLVVYHGGSATSSCIDAEGFFDANVHFANGTAQMLDLC